MNKQQLASKIWESANKMRSKIEANEYKDYILGFIFFISVSSNYCGILRNPCLTRCSYRGVHGNNHVISRFPA